MQQFKNGEWCKVYYKLKTKMVGGYANCCGVWILVILALRFSFFHFRVAKYGYIMLLDRYNKQIFHVFLFNIRNYSPEVILVLNKKGMEYLFYCFNICFFFKIWEDKD